MSLLLVACTLGNGRRDYNGIPGGCMYLILRSLDCRKLEKKSIFFSLR